MSDAPPPTPFEGTSVRLHSIGQNHIELIKLVRELTNLGLAEAKSLAESPLPIDVPVAARNIDLARALRDLARWGCQYELLGTAEYAAAMPMPAGPVPTGSFVVVLEEAGPDKVAMIKLVREISFDGLMESKELVEQTPSRFRLANHRLSPDDVLQRFTELGARIRIEHA